jgi:hypothetical protein
MVDRSEDKELADKTAKNKAREKAHFEHDLKLAWHVMEKRRDVLRELAKK